MVAAYRLVRHEFRERIWTGEGARRAGGRWNGPGTAVVYVSESRALAVLEQLVRMKPRDVLHAYVVADIRFEQSQIQRIDWHELPADWCATQAPPALQQYGDAWIAAAAFPVLAVPSAIIHDEWNYLLNPNHPAFAKLIKTEPKPFTFDARLS